MKRTIYFLMVALLLSFVSIVAQPKKEEPVKKTEKEEITETVLKGDLIKKYEAEKEKMNKILEQRIFQLAVNDPIAKERISKLAEADPGYNQIIAIITKLDEYIKELKPEKPKE